MTNHDNSELKELIDDMYIEMSKSYKNTGLTRRIGEYRERTVDIYRLIAGKFIW